MSDKPSRDPIVWRSDAVLGLAENAVYAVAGLLLIAGAVAVLASLGYHLVQDVQKGTEKAITATLDGLLLVFILLELLAAVRATMIERKLVAEPFLVVGIIASIKEIVVVSLEAKDDRGASGDVFDNAMTEIGVLAGVVLLLSLASFLVRRKEREPEEDEEDRVGAGGKG